MKDRRKEDRGTPDRRRAARVIMRVPVRLQRKGTVRWVETAIKDISMRGFRCVTYGAVWGVGTQVTFETPLFPAESPVTGIAKIIHMQQVAHIDEYELGLAYTDLSSDSAGKVRRYVEKNRKDNLVREKEDPSSETSSS